jgi:type IV pilus assembly protein PilY1
VSQLEVAGPGQGTGNWVVLVTGGYDPRFDSPVATGSSSGTALHVLDAATGRSLWSAGGADSDLALPGIAGTPSAPRALDLDGDGELDRAYLLDVAGSLWRIDFTSGRAASELATASRLARLGTGGHRFHATPDASIVRIGDQTRIAVAFGSGNSPRPRATGGVDRLYVIFDGLEPAAIPELSEEDLYDATGAEDAMPADAPGWFVRLDGHGAGEKVIGPAVTFDHALRFQTYQPLPADESAPCGPPRSVSRRYALDVRTALPLAWAVESAEDDAGESFDSGLPVDLRFGFPAQWDDACEGCRPRPFGIVGGETFDPGYAGDPVRTSWRKLTPPPASP